MEVKTQLQAYASLKATNANTYICRFSMQLYMTEDCVRVK